MTLIERAARLKARMPAPLRSGGDREHGVFGNWLVIATTAGLRSLSALPDGQAGSHRPRALCLDCCVDALLLAAYPLLKPELPKMRRLVRGSALNQPRMFRAHCPELAEQR